MPYNFAEVVLVPFPFANLNATKQRPAIVISSVAYNQTRPNIILMAITSQIRPPFSIGEIILQDWQHAGLLKPSMIKPLIATLEQNKVIKTMGQLSTADSSALMQIIQMILR